MPILPISMSLSPVSPNRKLRIALLQSVVSLASVLLTLLFLEGGIRLFRPVPLHPTDTFLAPAGTDGGSIKAGGLGLVPLATTRHQTSEYDVAVRINSLGLRDREIGYEKPEGTYRVLALGDSQTFGLGVEADQSYPKVIERALNAASGRTVEVINSGVPGAGTAHELDFLEREGWRYDPDLVVVGFFYNDLGNNRACKLFTLNEGRLERHAFPGVNVRRFKEQETTDPKLEGVLALRAPQPVEVPQPSVWIRHSHLARWVRERASRIYQRSNAQNETSSTLAAHSQALTARLFEEIERQCRERKVPLLIALIPSREEVNRQKLPNLYHKYGPLFHHLKEPQRSVLDLMPTIRATGSPPPYFSTDMHLTPNGQKRVGERIAQEILSLDPRFARVHQARR